MAVGTGLKKVKIGLGITRIDGTAFSGNFEDLGDAIAELLAAATNAGGGAVGHRRCSKRFLLLQE